MGQLGKIHRRRLRDAAHQAAEAVKRINQPLPDAFSEAALLQISENLAGLGDALGEADYQVLAHARFRVREARGLILENPGEPDAPSYYELERALNALLVEIGEELDRLPRQEQLALQPTTDPQLVVPPAVIERQTAALQDRIGALGEAQKIYEINFVKIVLKDNQVEIGRNLSLRIDALVKGAMELRAELLGTLINLDWVGHLSNAIKSLSDAVAEAIRELRAWAEELRPVIDQTRKVRQLGTRVANGGLTLLKLVRRLLDRQLHDKKSDDANLSTFQIFRDLDAPWCPEMVVLPPGTFIMGAPDDEGESSTKNERHDEADFL